MILKQNFSLVVTIVEAGFSENVIKASKIAGAEGATILKARGAGIHENSSFMGVAIQPEKEVVLIVVKKQMRKNVMREIVKTCNLKTEGKGLTFALPVENVAGIIHLSGTRKKDEGKEETKAENTTDSTPKHETGTKAEVESKKGKTEDETAGKNRS